MKFSASRSLLHGTVVLRLRAHRRLERAHLWLELEVAIGQAEAAFLHDVEVAGAGSRTCRSRQEPRASVQAAARARDRRQPVAAAELLRAHHLAVEELEHECVVLGHPRDERCADARLRRAARVVRLVLAVDREQPGVLAGDAHHERPVRRDDLVVHVRQSAGERLHRSRVVQLGNRCEDGLDGHRAILTWDSRAHG